MSENRHISQEEFLEFKNDTLNPEKQRRLLEHICSCDYCSEQLANCMADNIIFAPRDMKNNILNAVQRPEIQIARKTKEVSKQMQLLWYSLKVGSATIGALIVLILTMNFTNITTTQDYPTNISTEETTQKDNHFSLTTKFRKSMDSISSRVLDFSNSIINMEGIKHDQKEK